MCEKAEKLKNLKRKKLQHEEKTEIELKAL